MNLRAARWEKESTQTLLFKHITAMQPGNQVIQNILLLIQSDSIPPEPPHHKDKSAAMAQSKLNQGTKK